MCSLRRRTVNLRVACGFLGGGIKAVGRRDIGKLAERLVRLLARVAVHRPDDPLALACRRHLAKPKVEALVQSMPVGLAAGLEFCSDTVLIGCDMVFSRCTEKYGKAYRLLLDANGHNFPLYRVKTTSGKLQQSANFLP